MYGGAGPGGPVATPILYFTSSNTALAMASIEDAVRETDAQIINMSFSYEVPAPFTWVDYGFQWRTAWAKRRGLLLFSSAGNRGNYTFPNVDKRYCLRGTCWEPWWTAPCENSAVICVGGTKWEFSAGQSTGRATTTTDLFAGLDAVVLHVCDDQGACITTEVSLTILPQSDPECSDLPPTAEIVSPSDDQEFHFLGEEPEGVYYANVELIGDASDDQDTPESMTFDWFSHVDGDLGQGQNLWVRLHVPDGCSQWHEITLVVTDSGGKQAEDAVNVLIIGPECVGYIP